MNPLRKLVLHSTTLSVLLIVIVTPASADAIPQWSKRFGASSADRINSVAVDLAGNIVITGTFDGPASFGGAAIPDPGGFKDMFVAKYDATGTHLWSKGFVGEGIGIAVDAAGNIFVVGTYKKTTDFGGGPLTESYPGPGTGPGDAFIVKFDASGVHQWSRRFGASQTNDVMNAIAVDSSGSPVVTGTFGDPASFGGGTLAGGGNFDVFVAKYDSNGVHQWSNAFGGPRADNGAAVAVDDQNAVLVTGGFLDTVNFGGAPVTNAAGTQMFLVKYDAGGTYQWDHVSVGSGTFSVVAKDVVVDRLRATIVVGSMGGAADFGGGGLSFGGGGDVFIARYDQFGNHIWSESFGFAGQEGASAVAVAADGLFITGAFSQVNFGGGVLTNVGGSDVFLAKFNLAGYHLWSTRFGGSLADAGQDIAYSPLANIIIGGTFRGTADFGGGGLVSAGNEDAFLASYLDELPVPVLISTFDAASYSDRIELHWSMTSDEDLRDITVYRSESHKEPMLVGHAASSERSYIDTSVRSGTAYSYQLIAETMDGDIFRSPIVNAMTHRLSATLEQNTPNPFNPRTSIQYTLDEPRSVAIEIYDPAGALVTRLEQGHRNVGSHRAEWDGRDSAGRAVASGVYFYRLAGVDGVSTRKMVLLK